MSSIKSPENYYPPDRQKNKTEKGTLYLVGTPIGNLSDLSERARKVLSEVDFIAAEDTRNSGRLLAFYGIKKPMVSYFEHNKRERGELIVARIQNGEACALVTDAACPPSAIPARISCGSAPSAAFPFPSSPVPAPPSPPSPYPDFLPQNLSLRAFYRQQQASGANRLSA